MFSNGLTGGFTGGWLYLFTGFILLIACIDDFRSKKIHNKLILFLLPFVLTAVFFAQGLEGLKEGGISALLALVIGLPLTLTRMIGGGDFKLLVLVALTLTWRDFLWIGFYSLPWALLLGLVKIALDKKMKDFLLNLYFLFQDKKRGSLEFHTIPYSVALFFSWLSLLSLRGINLF